MTDPTGLVMKAWATLETALIRAARGVDDSVTTRTPPRDVLEALRRAAVIDDAYVSAAWNLRLVRNAVAHSHDVVPTSGQARTFAQTAERLTSRLN